MGQGRFNLAEDNKIMSALDMMRDQKAPSAIEGEKVLKHGQAAYDGGYALRSTWKMGRLYLTEKRLVFFQGQNKLFDISLDSLNSVNLIERNWIPGKLIKQLCIIQNGKESDGRKSRAKPALSKVEVSRGKRKFYISVKREEQWKEAIKKQITGGGRQVTKKGRIAERRMQITEIRRQTSKKRRRKV